MQRARHRSPEDRFLASLHPLPALLEALWNLAYYRTDKRRRKAGARKVSVLKVHVWCQASRAEVIAAYRRHLKYIREPRSITPRTLTRQLTAFKRDGLLKAVQPSPVWNASLQLWVAQPNVYTITYRGKLWIKKHARAITNQLVV